MPRRPRCDYFDDTERDLMIQALESYGHSIDSFLQDSEGDDVQSMRELRAGVVAFIAEWKGTAS